MKHKLISVLVGLGLLLSQGCVRDQSAKQASSELKSTVVEKSNPTAKQEARQAWKEKVKANQASKIKKGKTNPAVNASPNKTKRLKEKYKRPITTDKNKGVFISEIAQTINLTPAKTAALDKLILKYKRKGLDFKYFGGFYTNDKPFARDLAKIFEPIEVEKFKHFHAYWYDRIVYSNPEMPVSLYYRLNLSKQQFIDIIDIYSRKKIAKAAQGKTVIAKGHRKIERVLKPDQLIIYKEIKSINRDQFI